MYDPNVPQQPAKTSRPWYKMKRTWAGAFVGLFVIGSIAGGNDKAKDTASAPAPAPTKTVTATPSATSADDALKQLQKDNKKGQDDLKNAIEKASKSAEAAAPPADNGDLPDLVGMNHQAAQDAAQAAGFFNLREKDASGAERMLLWDRNWKVCKQEPAPGSHSQEITVTLYSVKLEESC
jgi:hypothetical protein